MRTKTIDLSSDAGVEWRFRPEDRDWTTIDVPAGGWRAQGHDDCDAGTYRTEIDIPRSAAGKVVRVAFAAVNFGAEVLAGSDADDLEVVATHVNGWMPFVADVTHLARPGKSLALQVNVCGRNKYWRDGKYVVPQGATWQPALADGIIRGIALEILPPVYVEDVFVRTDVASDCLSAEATVCNTTGEPVEVTLSTKLRSCGDDRPKYPDVPDVTATLAPGECRAVAIPRVGWGLGPESCWWPNVPYRKGYRARLHEMRIRMKADAHGAHETSQRFGFRRFTTRGNRYYLNGIVCNLRGDNQQEANFGTDAYGTDAGFGPPSKSSAGWPGAVDNLLRANFNVMRIHQVPPTPYMLDVCDELGLMIVDETPIRGSEHTEDFVGGRRHMIDAVSELVRRDRRHPSVVLWSVANEIWNERGLALALQAAALAEDDTRPIIVDGVDDLGPEIINMEHYRGGLGVPPVIGGTPRSDRPYGETESVWPSDNSWQGLAWMATATRIRRLKGNADIRNYVLNNAWSNYVPGQGPSKQDLEKKIKDIHWEQVVSDMEINPPIRNPWRNRLIRLLQQCFDPLTACDVQFDEANYTSNADGEWPVAAPELPAGSRVVRRIAVFNDEFAGEQLDVRWQLRRGAGGGKVLDGGRFALRVPLGEHRVREIRVVTPEQPGKATLVLEVRKDGRRRFREDRMVFEVV